MCYFHKSNITRFPPMPFTLYQKISKEIFKKIKILYLSCGAEPLCTTNIADFIKVAREYKIPFISMTSNCMLLTKDKIQSFVELGLDEIIVSVTGGTKNTYEENHAGADWDKLWQNLNSLKETKKCMSADRPVIKFNYIVTKKSINEVSLFIEKVKDFKPDYITLREITAFPNMDQEYYNNNKLGTNEISRIDTIKEMFLNAGIQVVNSIQCDENVDIKFGDIPEKYPCIYPFFQIYINAKGDFGFCYNNLTAGNLLTSTYRDINKLKSSTDFISSIKSKITCVCIKSCPFYIKPV
jgi:MoaA/NifB/PqqE/SkfB family radical SAM enzyme